MPSLLGRISADERRALEKTSQPDWVTPMTATLVREPFSDHAWIYELKLDGERCISYVKDGRARLLSRNNKIQNSSYPEIAEALESSSRGDAIFDGEVVALKDGAPSFSRLQRRMHVRNPDVALRTEVAVYYHVFDIVYLDGHDLSELPLRTRKSLLKDALTFDDPLGFVAHRNEAGEAYFEEVCSRPGWEGIIAKRADSPYRGTRSRDWLKFKCANEQEFVIGGYTDPQGSRTGLGALLIGYYDGDELHYAGKVGTGYGQSTLVELSWMLGRIERKTSPFVDRVRMKGLHWVTPKYVAQIGFAEWTNDGRLRHPRYLGLRRDKSPRAVVRERPS